MKLSPEPRKQLYRDWCKGATAVSLAKKYKCKRQTAAVWIEEGQKAKPNWRDAPRPGRPQVTTAAERSSIRRSAGRDRSAPVIAAGMAKRRGAPLSSSTVRRVLKQGKNARQYAPVNRTDVLSAVNKEKRLQFCINNARAHKKHWVYTDCKLTNWYYSHHGWCLRAWQKGGGKEGVPRGKTTPWQVAMYAAVAHGHKSKLYLVAPTPPPGSKARKASEPFTSSDFCDMMAEMKQELEGWELGKRGGYVLIRDHATQHTSAESQAFLQLEGVKVKEDFPPQGWDLNIIENVWGVFVGKLVGKHAHTTDGVIKAIRQAWAEVPMETINKLVASVPSRMQQVVEKGGAWRVPKGHKHRV